MHLQQQLRVLRLKADGDSGPCPCTPARSRRWRSLTSTAPRARSGCSAGSAGKVDGSRSSLVATALRRSVAESEGAMM